jgi:hypothetical protein
MVGFHNTIQNSYKEKYVIQIGEIFFLQKISPI